MRKNYENLDKKLDKKIGQKMSKDLNPVLKTIKLRRSSLFERSPTWASSFAQEAKNYSISERPSLAKTWSYAPSTHKPASDELSLINNIFDSHILAHITFVRDQISYARIQSPWHRGPFLISPLGTNIDPPQGQSCPPGVNLSPRGEVKNGPQGVIVSI
jgi:hypothetical protein